MSKSREAMLMNKTIYIPISNYKDVELDDIQVIVIQSMIITSQLWTLHRVLDLFVFGGGYAAWSSGGGNEYAIARPLGARGQAAAGHSKSRRAKPRYLYFHACDQHLLKEDIANSLFKLQARIPCFKCDDVGI